MRLILAFLLTFTSIYIADAESCKIGLLLPLSGQYAEIGEECSYGIELAKKRSHNINSMVDIQYFQADSKATGRDSVQEFQKLAKANGIDVALTIRSTTGMSVNPLSHSYQIPVVGGVGHSDFINTNPYAFRSWASVNDESMSLAKFIIKEQRQNIAIITTEDDWLISFKKSFIKNISAKKVIYTENLLPDFQAYATLITKLKKMPADAIFLNLGINHLVNFLRKARELNLNKQLYSVFWVKSSNVTDNVPAEALDNLVFVEMKSEYPVLLKNFRELYPEKNISSAVVSCYVGLEAILQSCSQLKTEQNDLYEHLLSLKYIDTYDQKFAIRDREIAFGIAVKRFSNGQINIIEDEQ